VQLTSADKAIAETTSALTLGALRPSQPKWPQIAIDTASAIDRMEMPLVVRRLVV
jgi:hypothetical protein